MTLSRMIENQCVTQLTESSKIVLIYGPRQAGKTTLAKQIAQKSGLKAIYANADLLKYETMFAQRDIASIQSLTEGYELLIIDEAQRIADIGLVLKIIHDEMPSLRVIATGSSSFDLANKVSEPLTGRKKVFHLLPFSLAEIKQDRNAFEINEMVDELLVYGMYPEVFTTKNIKNKTSILSEICESYLFKDILILGNIKYTSKIKDLLRLLAFQIGQQVSINELTQKLSINRETVERYIEILEKAFVIFRLPAYQRNMRKEVSKMDKIYFYDTGIRNCLIDNLKPISMRDDTGHLWENFIVAERRKQLLYQDKKANCYFWRTYTGAEIDYIEETGDGLFGYEIKLGKEKVKAPKAWIEEYNGGFDLINRKNYVNWLWKEL